MTRQCGCGCGCGCQTTGSAPAQRAGLDALAYRAGTHDSFLRTMLAALSTTTVEVPGEDEPLRPLYGLNTRDPDDPAVALLDAWATVADVLTFYQERIANEGYLRTATERFSVQELARLLGYQLRPGLAASAWLAFTLEPGYTVTIPPVTRVRSVPGPGQTAQTFETDEAVEARAEWNLLRPRRTEPQVLRADAADGPLYLAGIATGLRPGDAVLVTPAGGEPTPFQVIEVVPEPDSDRTRAGVRAWRFTVQRPRPTAPAGPFAAVAPGGILPLPEAAAVLTAVDRSTVDAPDRSQAPTADRVLGLLDDVAGYARANPPPALLALRVEALRTELRLLLRESYVQRSDTLRPWLGAIVAELDGIARRQVIELTGEAPAPRPVRAPGEPVLDALRPLEQALAKPASVPPDSPAELRRGAGDVFTGHGGVVPDLLTAFRPELRPLLQQAWSRLPDTGPPTAQGMHALRVRAGLFGANAPAGPGTDFEVTLRVAGTGTGRRFTGAVTVGGDSANWSATPADPRAVVDLPAAREQVLFTVTGGAGATPALAVLFARRFARFGIVLNEELVVSGTAGGLGSLEVRSRRGSTADAADLRVRGRLGGEHPLAEDPLVLWLDAPYERIQRGSWVLVERPWASPGGIDRLVVGWASEVDLMSREAYGIAGPSTRIVLDRPWTDQRGEAAGLLHGTRVYALSEALGLAERPITEPVCGERILLDGLHAGLQPGRRLIVQGERTDVTATAGPGAPRAPGVPGVPGVELLMLGGVEHHTTPAGVFTELLLARPLSYCYRPDATVIHGNVGKASHGERRVEVLGSGDATVPFQRFPLKHPHLTFLPAVAPSGAGSALEVLVDEVVWARAADLVGLGPDDRGYVLTVDDDGTTTVGFGDGRRGARPPTGVENLRATYRSGIGSPGNVDAGRLSQLATRPLGVQGVTNPLRSSGGADREDADTARGNAPRTVTSFGRFVSVSDAEDFAGTFAGIGKARAARLTDGRRQVVHVTIAGADDIPVDPSSDLHRNLVGALRELGDPYQPVDVAARELLLLVVAAGVRVEPDRRWELVEPDLRAALLDTFGFARRELAQDVVLSELLGVMHRVPGVAWVDVDVFDAASSAGLAGLLAQGPRRRNRVRARPPRTGSAGIEPAQLAILSAAVPDTLLLKELLP